MINIIDEDKFYPVSESKFNNYLKNYNGFVVWSFYPYDRSKYKVLTDWDDDRDIPIAYAFKVNESLIAYRLRIQVNEKLFLLLLHARAVSFIYFFYEMVSRQHND